MDRDNSHHRFPNTNTTHRYFVVALLGAVVGVLLGIAVAPTVLPEVYPHLAEPEDPHIPPPQQEEPAPEPDELPPMISSDFEELLTSVVSEVGSSVVSVTNVRRVVDPWGRSHISDSQGSGVVIDDRGHIVTNYHVIEDADEIIVEGVEEKEYTAEVVGKDPSTDLAVLRIDSEAPLAPVKYGDSDAVRPGQLAIAIGNPLGREFARSVTVGVVSGIRASMYGQDARQRVFQLIQTDASINPGNSGGALLNSRGELVGINTLKFASAEVEGMGFAIPSNTVQRIVGQLIEHGAVQRSWMGVSVSSVEDARQQGVQLQVDTGVFLARVVDDSPAHQAGLREGDVITGIEGEPVEEVVELLEELEERQPGDVLLVEVKRNGETLTAEIQLGTMPQ